MRRKWGRIIVKGIIDLDPEVPDGAFNFGVVVEQELHSSQITGRSGLPLSVVANEYRKGVGLGRCFQSIRRQAARIASS